MRKPEDKPEVQGKDARITSDAGLLACRELDEVLGLTKMAPIYLQETRGGRNVQHELVPLLRQSVYSRLAGYEDTNDAIRLARDPAMQAVIGRRALEKQAASTNTLSRFETEVLVIDTISVTSCVGYACRRQSTTGHYVAFK